MLGQVISKVEKITDLGHKWGKNPIFFRVAPMGFNAGNSFSVLFVQDNLKSACLSESSPD